MRNTVLAMTLLILLLPLAVPDIFAVLSAWNHLLVTYINNIVRYVLIALLAGGAIFFAVREFLDQRAARNPLRQKVFPVISSSYLAISAAMEAHDAKSEAHKLAQLINECRNIKRLNTLLDHYHHRWDALAACYMSNNTDKARIRAAQDELDVARDQVYAWLGVQRETSRK